jgi:hypothetical protein
MRTPRLMLKAARVQATEISPAVLVGADHSAIEHRVSPEARSFLHHAGTAFRPIRCVHGIEPHAGGPDVDLKPVESCLTSCTQARRSAAFWRASDGKAE